MQSVTYDTQALGLPAGFNSGGGFDSNNPLYWLIILGFLRGNNGGLFGGDNNASGGYVAGQLKSDVDCLARGQDSLAEQIRQQSDNSRFQGLAGQISELAGIARDGQALNTAQLNNLSSQLAECCCDLRTGQADIKTAIAMQTTELTINADKNTQRIVDLMTNQQIEAKNDRIRELEQQAQTASLAAIIRDQCGNGKGA